MNKLLKWLFGDKDKFEIFINEKYSGDYSVRHMRGYLYINPYYGGPDEGPGISYDKSRCAAHSTIESTVDMIGRWVKLVYQKSINDVTILIRDERGVFVFKNTSTET